MIGRIIMAAMITLAGPALTHGQNKCGIARDYLNQAREAARPGLGPQEMLRLYYQLKQATNFCPESGDAYYYRHLFAKQLGLGQRDIEYPLKKAAELDSQLLSHGNDPFKASHPDTTARVSVSTVVREKWALVVGISKFRGNVKELSFAAKDARDFAALLQNPLYGRFKPGNVRVLTDSEATTDKIKEGLNWLARNAGKDDLVTVFISSHGSPRWIDAGGVSYVITHDTDVSNEDRLYATALEMIEVVEAMTFRSKAQRGVLFLDTCYSGAATSGIRLPGAAADNGSPGQPTSQSAGGTGNKALVAENRGISVASVEPLSQTVGRVVITASQPTEQSYESDRLRNGFFTYYLIEALKQNGGRTSIEQVYDYLRLYVSKQVTAEKGVSQTPMMSPSKPMVEIRVGVETQQ
jgi:hypothetical protein